MTLSKNCSKIAKSLLLLCIPIFFSCNNNKYIRPTTSLDVGRDFIKASLHGDFKTAEILILQDTENIQLFEAYKQYYNKLTAEKKKSYQTASYEINKYVDINDSVTIINYSNDYMKKPMDIKLIRHNNEWWIDFKYTYSGNLPIN